MRRDEKWKRRMRRKGSKREREMLARWCDGGGEREKTRTKNYFKPFKVNPSVVQFDSHNIFIHSFIHSFMHSFISPLGPKTHHLCTSCTLRPRQHCRTHILMTSHRISYFQQEAIPQT